MVFKRFEENPLITPQDVQAFHEGFEVVGTFNCGVTTYQGEVRLLIRVAERPIQTDTKQVLFPHMEPDGRVVVRGVSRKDTRYDLRDTRIVHDRQNGENFLTSISHLRLARSSDGRRFAVDDVPWLCAEPPYETFGVEDARITRIADTYYVNYSAVSHLGISTGLVSTRDFTTQKRHGIMLSPANRDVTIFPEQIDGRYVCYHRPMPSPFGGLNIWIATSPDLRYWGDHRLVYRTQQDGWESGRVGGGAPPLRTKHGWLSIYHAADLQNRYCLGAFLTALDDPGRITRRSMQPILSPEARYEVDGFFGKVVFTCGALLEGGRLVVYYGAADKVIAGAEARLSDVLAMMEPT